MKIFYNLLTVFIYYAIIGPAAAASSDENLCTQEEMEVASCSLKGNAKKIASICVNQKSGQLSYYFGTKAKLELNVKLSKNYGLYRWIDQATHVTFLGFNRNGYSYIIGIPQEKPGASAFLLVKKSGSPLDFNHPKLCKNNSFGDKDLVEHIVDVEKEGSDENFIFPPAGVFNKRR